LPNCDLINNLAIVIAAWFLAAVSDLSFFENPQLVKILVAKNYLFRMGDADFDVLG